MIIAAIEALNEKGGSNKSSISKQMESAYPNLPPAHTALLTHSLSKMKQSGELVFVKNNYMKSSDPNAPPKRGRGRPPKPKDPFAPPHLVGPPRPRGRPPKPKDASHHNPSTPATGRPRGRPKKPKTEAVATAPAGRGRGRPPKVKPAVAPVAG